jgi:hypothetical protein
LVFLVNDQILPVTVNVGGCCEGTDVAEVEVCVLGYFITKGVTEIADVLYHLRQTCQDDNLCALDFVFLDGVFCGL